MKNFGIVVILTLLVSCSGEPKSKLSESNQNEINKMLERQKGNKEEEGKELGLNILRHKFRDSDLEYEVEITKINFETKKGAFTTTSEKYSKPESLDGLKFSINFKMRNPYDKEMRVPFPSYFFITAPQFGHKLGVYNRTCKCYIMNQQIITDSKGKAFYKRMADFDKNETKEFVLNFTKPFPKYSTLKSITLVGFNKYLRKEFKFKDVDKMNESEKEIYFAAKSETYSLEISVKDEAIISKRAFEK